MDVQIRNLAAIKREIAKIVARGETKDDKLLLIQFGERQLAELKAEINAKS